MKWIVLKFGGTSVSSYRTWDTIVARVKDLLQEHDKEECGVWIVVSALSQVTNRLIQVLDHDLKNRKKHDFLSWIREKHETLMKELDVSMDEHMRTLFGELERLLDGIELTGDSASSRLRARVLSFGERLSSRMGHLYLVKRLSSVGVSWVDATSVLKAAKRIGEQDEDKYLNAEVIPAYDRPTAESKRASPSDRVVITQGFIASTPKGRETCLLGRGGSDTSGALFSAVLGAERYEIWTDVHGMFTADPRTVKAARHIRELSYREAQELAAMGAKVLNPRCLAPTARAQIPVEVHNTMDPKNRNECTRIVHPDLLKDKKTTVMAVARRLGQVLITLTNVDMYGTSGFLSKAFAPFELLGISVDLIATSQYAISMTLDHIPGGVDGSAFESLISQLKKIASVHVHRKCAVVSIVGRHLRTVLHLMADAFKELAQYDVLLLSESSEDLNLSFVIDQSSNSSSDEEIDALVASLHKVLLEQGEGLIPLSPSLFGSTLPQLLHAAASPQASSAHYKKDTVNAPVLPKLELNVHKRAIYPSPPCSIIDLSELKRVAERIDVYCCTFSMNPAVLRLMYMTNSNVVFYVNSLVEAETLRFVLGGDIKITFPKYLSCTIRNRSANLQPMFDPLKGVEILDIEAFISTPKVLEDVAVGTGVRIVHAQIIEIAAHGTDIIIDAFWDRELNEYADIVPDNEESSIDGTHNIKAYSPNSPLQAPKLLISNVKLNSKISIGDTLLIRNITSGKITFGCTEIPEFIISS